MNKKNTFIDNTVPNPINNIIVIIILSLLIFSCTFIYLYIYKVNASIIKNVNLLYPHHESILFVIDYRNKHAIGLMDNTINYIKRNNYKINVILHALKGSLDNYKNECILLNKKAISKKNIKSDYIYLFNRRRKLIWDGELKFNNTKVRQIIESVLLNKKTTLAISDYFGINRNIKEMPQFEFINNNLAEDYPYCCYFFYDDYCMTCNNINNIIEWDKLQKKYPIVKMYYVSMFKYSREDIALIKKNYSLTIDILIPDGKARLWWYQIGNETIGTHPFIGLIIVIDKKGNIIFESKDILVIKKWLEYIDTEKGEVK